LKNTAPTFDYGKLPAADRKAVQDDTRAIKECIAKSALAYIEIGRRLISVRSRMTQGTFKAWLVAEFDWSRGTAYNHIWVAERFADLDCVARFQTWALVYLARPDCPEHVREIAIAEARAGAFISCRRLRQIVGRTGKYTTVARAVTSASAAISRLIEAADSIHELPLDKADEFVELLINAAIEVRRATRGTDDLWQAEGKALPELADVATGVTS